ncbi:hypothetical protein [Levilactobacillus yonginensis]|uniref:hypothetical protein n=1 Tax=Levilactobacillus yonginensis TaxID=1054041 RepID=UPI00345D3F0E
MSKELYFTDGNNEVKYLDTTASFNLAITQDGSAFDLTNAKSIDVKVANDTGYVFDKPIDMATIKQPLAGLITMPVDTEVMNALVPDDYTIEVWVTLSSLITPGSQEGLTDDGTTSVTATSSTGTTTYNAIFPSDDPQGFTITENVMSDSGDVIPVMSLDDFQQEFDQLKTDLTNKVSTLQGPKGDTGQGLEIKGKVDTTSQLPKTASEGDGYLVGEELYVWTNGAWKDCGSLQGPQGIKGNTGTGVSSTTIQYQISSSATTAPTGIWSDNIIATTNANPNLWMKATLNYTDDTTKDFYLVSQKGDKGDIGKTGPRGPIGPQGPVGSGLVVKGTVKEASQLPKTGNQEGYCYFVGTDLYVWDSGAWKNCGSVSPNLSNYVTVTDLNNGLSTKVTDNKNGTEQLNGVQVQPFNKLSDTIGGRNLLIGSTDNIVHYDSVAGYTIWKSSITQFNVGDTLNVSADITSNAGNTVLKVFLLSSAEIQIGYLSYSVSEGQTAHAFVSKTIPTGTTNILVQIDNGNTPGIANVCAINHQFANTGSIATDWTPAPEDKVNVTDMRKPASDVAGIEEVNAKQDKIGYTPADDSKVVHSTGTEEIAGQKTFDVAPIDKTTGNPYITKDGVPAVPSTLADTTKDANFTGKLQKSGIDVATTTDVTNAVSGATSQVAHLSGTNNFTGSIQHNGNSVGAHIQASKNDENSAISDSATGNSDDIYYWLES